MVSTGLRMAKASTGLFSPHSRPQARGAAPQGPAIHQLPPRDPPHMGRYSTDLSTCPQLLSPKPPWPMGISPQRPPFLMKKQKQPEALERRFHALFQIPPRSEHKVKRAKGKAGGPLGALSTGLSPELPPFVHHLSTCPPKRRPAWGRIPNENEPSGGLGACIHSPFPELCPIRPPLIHMSPGQVPWLAGLGMLGCEAVCSGAFGALRAAQAGSFGSWPSRGSP